MNALKGWLKQLQKPDPLKEELKRSRALTESLCKTMKKFEEAVEQYHDREPIKYGRRDEDDTIPRRA